MIDICNRACNVFFDSGYHTVLLEKSVVSPADKELSKPVKATMEDFNKFMKGKGKAALTYGMAYYKGNSDGLSRVRSLVRNC